MYRNKVEGVGRETKMARKRSVTGLGRKYKKALRCRLCSLCKEGRNKEGEKWED